MRRRWIASAALFVLAATLSCSRDPLFKAGTYTISGSVKLRGFHVDRNGDFAGTRIVGDADGLPVELLYGKQVLARTTTVDGLYRFDGVRPGGYNVRVRIIPGIEWVTSDIVVVTRDVAVRDTLMPTSIGSMLPVPNPFVDTMQVYFAVDDTTQAKVALLDGSARPLRTFFDHVIVPAVYRVDLVLPHLPAVGAPTYYWVTYAAGEDVRTQLLIREPAATAVASSHRAARAGKTSEASPFEALVRRLRREKAFLVR